MEPLQTSAQSCVIYSLHDRIRKPRLLEGATTSVRLECIWMFLDGWFDKGQHFSSRLHKYSHLSICLTLKAHGSFVSKQMWHDGVPQSESICLDHCAFPWPCAWDERTFRSHMEQKCCHTELLFMCFAAREIASNLTALVLHFRVRTISLSQYTCYGQIITFDGIDSYGANWLKLYLLVVL